MEWALQCTNSFYVAYCKSKQAQHNFKYVAFIQHVYASYIYMYSNKEYVVTLHFSYPSDFNTVLA